MKKSIKLLSIFTVLFFLSMPLIAQECSGISLNRNIQLNKSSDIEEIKIDVAKNTNHMNIGVNSTIRSGSLTVELFDPKGNKQGNFSVESQISSNDQKKECVSGQMQKTIKNPMSGHWIVKLKPKKAQGEVSICSRLVDEK